MGLRRFGPPDRGTRDATLVCFPHAGGGATGFAAWQRMLPDRIDLCAHVAPGREERGRETPLGSVAELIEDVLPDVRALPDPLVLVGHSAGASVAYELAYRLGAAGRPPARLVVLAAAAPGAAAMPPPRDDHELELLWKRLGASPAGLARPGFREWIFPVLRADIAAHSAYRPPTDRLPAAVPVTVLYGDRDAVVTVDEAGTWQARCAGPFEIAAVPGGHFFPQTSAAAAVDAVVRALDCPKTAP